MSEAEPWSYLPRRLAGLLAGRHHRRSGPRRRPRRSRWLRRAGWPRPPNSTGGPARSSGPCKPTLTPRARHP